MTLLRAFLAVDCLAGLAASAAAQSSQGGAAPRSSATQLVTATVLPAPAGAANVRALDFGAVVAGGAVTLRSSGPASAGWRLVGTPGAAVVMWSFDRRGAATGFGSETKAPPAGTPGGASQGVVTLTVLYL